MQWGLGFRQGKGDSVVDVAHGEDDCRSGKGGPARKGHSLGNFSFSLEFIFSFDAVKLKLHLVIE